MLGRASAAARGTAMANALRLLEARFGDFDSLRHPGAHVLTRDRELVREDIEELVAHRALAVHVRGFYPADLSEKLADKMLADVDVRNWNVASGGREAEASDVDAVGTPHNVAFAKGELDSYFDSSILEMRKWRHLTDERQDLVMGPMDKFRLELDEVWRHGCSLSRDKKHNDRPFLPGVPRIMRPSTRYDPSRWTRGFAHVDELAIMRPDRGLFSANIYLRNAPSGGELQIWPITFSNRWDFYRNAPTLSLCLLQSPEAQALLRERLPEPITVRVKPGDLVLICTQRPHAVRGPVVGGTRVSIQGFIQHEQGQPLRLEA